MNICGIIAEFNPLHNGHKYIIDAAKKTTECDALIIVMSGDYVQRGEPAIINKYQRTRMALLSGADAVFMLPSMLSTGSAQYFARGGVSLLNSLGAKSVFFGSESGSIEELSNAEYVKGNPQKPNDILGREYIKAISDLNLCIKPVTTRRVGTDYNDSYSTKDGFCSASYIREAINNSKPFSDIIIPADCLGILENTISQNCIVYPDSISDILFARLMEHSVKGYDSYFDVYKDLSDKILSNLSKYKSFTNFISVLKSKDITYSHISRALLHIALGIDKTHIETIKDANFAPFARLLGFNKDKSQVISYIKEHATVPVITNLKDFSLTMSGPLKDVFDTDINASHIYSYMQNKKTAPFIHEYTQPLIIL